MKLSIFLCGLWLFFIPSSLAQKEISRTYAAQNITQLVIDANAVHSLTIAAGIKDQIELHMHVEGETSEEIVVKEQLETTKLSLGFSAWPLATIYNDKLSVHKMISVVVRITVPEHLFVSVTSQTSSMLATGTFNFLYVDIEDKHCVLQNFTGNADLKTNKGDIDVIVNNVGTWARVNTTYGKMYNTLTDTGHFHIYAESEHGDISLRQTQ